MTNKRHSLASILEEDQGAATVSEIRFRKNETRNLKSDFIKLSVTLPPAMFEKLQGLSLKRRCNKEPYTMSQLVRESLAAYLDPPAQ